MKKTSYIKKIALQLFMIIVSLAILLPVLIVINYSFKTRRELFIQSPIDLPQTFQFGNFMNAVERLNLGTTFFNTFFYTFVSVLILAFLSCAAAWAIARNKSRFYKFSYLYFIIGILIPFQALFLPIYSVGTILHLTNSSFGIILMYVATGLSFSVFIMTSFMTQIPVELEEASRIDGCSIYRTFFSIVLPLLKPAIATLIILQAFMIWNDYLMASLFVSDNNLKTLNVMFQQLFSQEASDYTTAMAAIVISMLPIMALFIALQKYFIKGLAAGAVKG